MQPSDDEVDDLVNRNLGLVHSIAANYNYANCTHEDLYTEGLMGLWEAAKRYTPSTGRFAPYAGYWIRLHIRRYGRDFSNPVRIPGKNHDMMDRIKRLDLDIERVGATHIAVVVGRSKAVVVETLNAVRQPLRLDADRRGEHGDGASNHELLGPLIEEIDEAHGNAADQLIDAINGLPDNRLKEIIILRFGIGQPYPLTLVEVAERFHLTHERVRQLQHQAIRQLRKSLGVQPLNQPVRFAKSMNVDRRARRKMV